MALKVIMKLMSLAQTLNIQIFLVGIHEPTQESMHFLAPFPT
jgi:anti-anti-sigma regulatory factor